LTNLRIVKANLLTILAFDVIASDEERVDGVGFLDIQPVQNIEAFLLEAGSLTHQTDVAIGNVKFL